MGQENSSSSTNGSDTQVILNVYDLTPLNNYMGWFGFGIFHSGIEVYGMEYGFGAHDFSISGVFEVEPKSCPGLSIDVPSHWVASANRLLNFELSLKVLLLSIMVTPIILFPRIVIISLMTWLEG